MIVFSYNQLRRFSADQYGQDYEVFRTLRFADLDRLPIERRTDPIEKEYDVFLSHSISDLAATLGMKEMLEAHGLTVYIDWMCDKDLIPTTATKQTTERILLRMNKSNALIYVFSVISRKASVWMPWELGYFHGRGEKVAVVGVGQHPKSDHRLTGNEFLLIYPYLVSQDGEFFVGEESTRYARLKQWVNGVEAILDRRPVQRPDEPHELIERARKELKR